MNLTKASSQWMTRPADERYWGLEDMIGAAEIVRRESSEVEIPAAAFRAERSEDGDIGIAHDGRFFSATHFAFQTMAQRAGAPAEYLRRLPADLTVQCLNTGLATIESDSVALVRQNGTTQLRAVTSERYGRVWYDDTVRNLQEIVAGTGWRVPPGRPAVADPRTRIATEEDCLRPGVHGLSIKPGDLIAPAGCYMSDRDIFIFMVDETVEVAPGLFRGFFLANSEVRARVYEITTFLYQSVCGNHIVWSAEGVQTFKVKHLGDNTTERAFMGARHFLGEYKDGGAEKTRLAIEAARTKEIGKDNEEVLENVQDFVNRRRILIPAKRLEEAQEIALTERYGNPRTAFAMVSGLTEIARDISYSDQRANLNREAGKILNMVA